jgi:ubiquinone/menaquinone biosynthesis C-methylase UbiE
MDEQRELILDQFTRQAIPFSQLHARDDSQIHQLLIKTAGIEANDHVLDVACGPGLVACEVAKAARHVTGVDLTPAMIEQARKHQQSLALMNLDFVVGDAHPLPFADGEFTRAITRYSFHHFTSPRLAFAEMVRVCRPGGRVTVCDVFMNSTEQAELYDRMEKHRDPSHTHALQLNEFEALFSGLSDVRREFYKYPVSVDVLLSRSFPEPGGAEAFREMVAGDIGVDRIGIDANRENGLGFAFPVVIFSGKT